jgi:hypothetical protein
VSRERYTVEQAADLSGLSVKTLKQYPFITDLVRGEDFYIHRFARFRRRTYWTARGIARLKTRSYRVRDSREYAPAPAPYVETAVGRRYVRSSVQEMVARLRNAARIVYGAYLQTPCAVPNCPCMTHRLGLPQADEIAAVMALKADAKAKRSRKS